MNRRFTVFRRLPGSHDAEKLKIVPLGYLKTFLWVLIQQVNDIFVNIYICTTSASDHHVIQSLINVNIVNYHLPCKRGSCNLQVVRTY